MGLVENEVEDAERFNEIIHVLADEGLGIILDELDLTHRLPASKKLKRNKEPGPERLRETFEELGPTFIKFGQILAERPDIMPEEYTGELENLQDDVPGFDSEKAKEIVDEEVGLENFQEFEEEHIAAASIAQVHRATLKSGEEVVVKIRRPEIKEEVTTDLEILEFLAKRGVKRSDRLSDMQLLKSVKEFSRWTREELNLKKEARNGERLSENLSDQEGIKIPEMYTDLTTEKVLVMEYIDGVKVSNLEALEELEIDPKEVATNAMKGGLKQILRDGFFHADPHQSNFLIQEEGNLVLIDFGMMGRISDDQRKDLGLLILHMLREDTEKALDDLKRIGHVQDDADLNYIKTKLEEKNRLLQNASIGEESLTEQVIELTIESSRHGIVMPQSLILAGKAMVTVEGVGMTIYPDYRIGDEFKETVRNILQEEFKPEKLMEELSLDMIENRDLITELPSKLNSMAEKKESQVKVVNQQRTQAVTAALILSSAFLLTQGRTTLTLLGAAEILLAAHLFHQE
ncbi:MAG: ABC1 kinase family protein [Candidatus Nanohaloarchaea archaeon]